MAIRQGKRARMAAMLGEPAVPLQSEKTTFEYQGASRIGNEITGSQNSSGQIPVYADVDVFGVEGDPLTEEDLRFEDKIHRSAVYGGTTEEILLPPNPAHARRNRKKHAVNWWKIGIALGVLFVFILGGIFIFLRQTDTGQKILARLGQDASSTAYWEIGEERMDTGDVENAILAFERARAIDEEAMEQDNAEYNVPGLLMLASTYEATNRTAEAEQIYIDLYTNIVPTANDAYTNEIRILLATGREAEAADLMMQAYQKTGQTSYRTQRNELLPKAPETNVYAGLYEEKKYITLTSQEGYDIYYTFNAEAQLPEEGTHYEQEIFLDEGIYTMRAVAVNGQLVSDELNAVYRIIMPSPQTPRASLAPNTYKQRQRVRLWPGLDNMEDDDITIYYTIDGSLPDADSPIYTGDPVLLPGNYVDLHAVAVNRYGKASNTLSIRYKILAKPYPLTSYDINDTGSGLTLCLTTWDEFRAVYGDALDMEEVRLSGIADPCQKRIYPWGYAVFYKQSGRQLLGELYFTTSIISAPRGTGIGNTENDVVGKFRDMGQLASASGNRGLYENDSGKGKIYQQDDGTRIIRYTANTADSHKWQLEYTLSASGVVVAVDQLYIP